MILSGDFCWRFASDLTPFPRCCVPTLWDVSVGSSTGAGSEIATSADLTNRYINLAATRFVGNFFDLTILEISRFNDVTIYKTYP